jgi:hypothetical protein
LGHATDLLLVFCFWDNASLTLLWLVLKSRSSFLSLLSSRDYGCVPPHPVLSIFSIAAHLYVFLGKSLFESLTHF